MHCPIPSFVIRFNLWKTGRHHPNSVRVDGRPTYSEMTCKTYLDRFVQFLHAHILFLLLIPRQTMTPILAPRRERFELNYPMRSACTVALSIWPVTGSLS